MEPTSSWEQEEEDRAEAKVDGMVAHLRHVDNTGLAMVISCGLLLALSACVCCVTSPEGRKRKGLNGLKPRGRAREGLCARCTGQVTDYLQKLVRGQPAPPTAYVLRTSD